ncbi:MAG: tetratricopeptide repeat protein [Ignavibacteria bacterium]|nr:tetratricopeptide repeat protein [Ignavibacteria bacterium]
MKEIGNTSWLANNLTSIGSVYSELSDFILSLEYLQKALSLFESLNDTNGIAIVFGNIGSAYRGLGEYTTAFEYYRKALAIEENNGKIDGVVVNLGSLGKIYATTDYEDYNPAMAEEYLLKAIALGESINARHFLFEIHKNLADLYRLSERWKDFAIHFEAYHKLEKEVASEEAHQRSEQLEHRRKIDDAERNRQIKLARFQEQEKILHNILPSPIAERMVAGETTIVDSYESVSVLFADIVGFTKLSQFITPEALVAGLSRIFNTFDLLSDKHGCEKIKTIGDSYMVVAGMPERCDNHAERIAALAFDMLRAIEEFPPMVENTVLRMRIGIHSGRVVAGIIGKNKYAYDLWGDAVNTASRMESHGEPGKIHCTEEFILALSLPILSSLSTLQFIERGEMDIKGKGIMKTYFLVHNS